MESMNVYDINGNLLTGYDLSKGKLTPSTRTEHHETIPPVEEISNWEEKHHPNGGISRRKIIKQHAVPGKDAWDEEITIYVYKPYTPEELETIEAEKNKPTDSERIDALEASMDALIGGIESVQ